MSFSFQRHRDDFWTGTAAFSLALAIMSFVSPQVGQLGRGLRTTVPSLIISALAIRQLAPGAFAQTVKQQGMIFLLGALYLLQAGLRFAYAPDAANLWHTFFEGPLITLIMLVWIFSYNRLGRRAVQWLRTMILFGWCLSLTLGVPTLLANPGVARLTMGNIFAAENAAIWAPFGVGEYTVYTSFGVCVAPLLLLAKDLDAWMRIPAFVLVFFGAVAVIMSTFTMAAAMLVIGLLCLLAAWIVEGRGLKRAARALAIIVPLVLIPVLYTAAGEYKQTKFIVAKFERLYDGLTTAGLAKGDETNRGEWFVQEMETFSDEPFLGYIPKVTGETGHGHSSLSNSLVLFGIFGTALWMAVLWKVFRFNWENAVLPAERHGLIIACTVFVLSGILNPLWHSQASLCSLFTMTLPGEPEADEVENEEEDDDDEEEELGADYRGECTIN